MGDVNTVLPAACASGILAHIVNGNTERDEYEPLPYWKPACLRKGHNVKRPTLR